MKKQSLFILAALLLSVFAALTVFGQEKTPVKPPASAPAPEFQINPAKIYTVTLSGTIDKFNAMIFSVANGVPLIDETDLPAKVRKEAKVNATEMNTSLQLQLQALILADHKKFTADSLAALKKQ